MRFFVQTEVQGKVLVERALVNDKEEIVTQRSLSKKGLPAARWEHFSEAEKPEKEPGRAALHCYDSTVTLCPRPKPAALTVLIQSRARAAGPRAN